MATQKSHVRASGHETCNDPVVGAILSGWRYDISGISPDLRVDYEAHLYNCAHCRKRQRVHRTWDVMLLAITTLSFAAFLLAAVVMHRVEAPEERNLVRPPMAPIEAEVGDDKS